MARRRRTPAYRKNRYERTTMVVLTMLLILISSIIGIKSMSLMERKSACIERESRLKEEIEAEKDRTKEIDAYREYVKTPRYKEEMAKDKLGMVYEGDIIFQEKK